MSAGLAFYRGGTALLSPFARLFLEARARRGREDPARIGERLGRARVNRPPGPLVWLHGASIGEGLALHLLAGDAPVSIEIQHDRTVDRGQAGVEFGQRTDGCEGQFAVFRR